MNFRVVDTNVAIVASNRTPHASSDCVLACITVLEDIVSSDGIVMDDGMLIFEEYRSRLSISGQPGVGDVFFKWVFNHHFNPARCELVSLTLDSVREFMEFPDDPRLSGFDRADRKFVAVALKSVNSPIVLNAVDSDWWNDRDVLAQHGVNIQFVCPDAFP